MGGRLSLATTGLMLLLAVSVEAAWQSIHARLPLHSLASSAPPRACAASMKLNKQQELARLMEAAERQRQGLPVDMPEAAPKQAKQKPKQTPKKGPKTREELFAAMGKFKEQNPDSIAGPTSNTRYGATRKAPAPMPSSSAPKKKAAASAPRPPPAAAADPAYTYSDFKDLLQGSGKTSRAPRAISEERLRRGALLPSPSGGLQALDGVPNAYASLEALAGGSSTLVLVASRDDYIAERLRQTLIAFATTLPVKQLDAAVAGVCAAPPSALRKLSRKAGVSFPLLSDPDARWISALNCAPGGEVVVYLVDPFTESVLSSFAGVGDFVPATLVATVKSALKQRNDELYAPPGAPSSSSSSDAIPAADELPDEWAWAAAPATPPPAAAPTARAPPPAAPRAPLPSRPSSSAGLSKLEAENEKLKQQLREAQERDAANRIAAENAELKAQLRLAEKAREEEAKAAARVVKEVQAEQARKKSEAARADAQAAAKAKLQAAAEKKAATQAQQQQLKQQQAQAQQAQQQQALQAQQQQLASDKLAAEAAAAAAVEAEQLEKESLLAQLKAAQEATAAEVERRRAAEEMAAAEMAAAQAAGAAAREAAEAAQRAAEAAQRAAEQAPNVPASAPAAPPAPSPTSCAGDAIPANLPLEALTALKEGGSVPSSLSALANGKGRLVMLFGRLDSPVLSEALQ